MVFHIERASALHSEAVQEYLIQIDSQASTVCEHTHNIMVARVISAVVLWASSHLSSSVTNWR